MDADALARQLVEAVARNLDKDLGQITRCAGLLGPDELWQRPNQHCNAVGNLLLHLTGNVQQWILAGLGGRAFRRNRPAEFAERGPLPAAQLLPPLQQTVREACQVLGGLDAAALLRRYTIQGYDVAGVQAVFHVGEHFSFHTGQIIHITKALRDVDLSLYDAHGRRLDGARNSPS